MSSQDGTLSSTRIINSDTSFKTLTGSVGNLIKSSETWMRTAVGTPNTFRSTITVFSSLTNCTYNSCENTRDEDTKIEADNNEAKQEYEEENNAPAPEILFDATATTSKKTKKQHYKKRKPIRIKKSRHQKYNLSCLKLRNYRKAHVKIKRYITKKLKAVDNNAVDIINGSMTEISHSRGIKKVLAKVNLLDDSPVLQNIPTEPDAEPMSNSEINSPSTESEINHITFDVNIKSDSESTLTEKKFASTNTSKANINDKKSTALCNILETVSPFRFGSKELAPKSTPYPPLTLHRSDEQNINIKDTYTKLTKKPSPDQGIKSDSTDVSSYPFTYTDSSGNSTLGDKTWPASNAIPCNSIHKMNDSESKIIPAEFSEGDMEFRAFADLKLAEAKLTLKVDSDETLPLFCNGKVAGSMLLTKKESDGGLEPIKPEEESSSSEQINDVVPLIKQHSAIPLPRDYSIKISDSNKLSKARSLFQYSTAVPSIHSSSEASSKLNFETNSAPKYPSIAELPLQSELNIPNSIKHLETSTITKTLTQKPLIINSNFKPEDPHSTRAKRLCHPEIINNKSEVVLRVQDMSGSTITKQSEPFSYLTGKTIDLVNKSFATTSSDSEKSHPSDFTAAATEQAGEISNYIKQQLVELGMNKDSDNANLTLKEKVNESVYNIEDSSKMVVISNPLQSCSEEFRTVFPTTLTELWDRLIYAIELAVAKAEKSMSEKVIEEVKKLHSSDVDKERMSKVMSRTAEGDVPATSKAADRSGLTPVQCLQCDIIDGQIIDHMVQIRKKVDAIISDCLPTYSSNSLKMKDLKLNREILSGIETPEKVIPRSGEGDVEQQPPESPSFQLQHVPRTRYRIVRRVVRFIIENSLVITTVPTLVIFFLLMYSFIAFLIRM